MALANEHADLFLQAVADVVKARAMAHLARASALGRESLQMALALGAKPRYGTVLKVIRGLGVELQTSPVARKA